MVSIGQKVQFDPFGELSGFGIQDNKGKLTTGKVVAINWQNGWFSVEYGEPKLRTSFKFCDIGSAVKICG